MDPWDDNVVAHVCARGASGAELVALTDDNRYKSLVGTSSSGEVDWSAPCSDDGNLEEVLFDCLGGGGGEGASLQSRRIHKEALFHDNGEATEFGEVGAEDITRILVFGFCQFGNCRFAGTS